MIVGGGQQRSGNADNEKKRKQPPRSKNRAAAKLKHAIAEGRLDELLWGAAELEKTEKLKNRIRRPKAKTEEELDEDRKKQEEEDIMDEIKDEYNQKVMWNELLTDHKITHRYEFPLKPVAAAALKQRYGAQEEAPPVRATPSSAGASSENGDFSRSSSMISNNNINDQLQHQHQHQQQHQQQQHTGDHAERPLSSPSKLQSSPGNERRSLSPGTPAPGQSLRKHRPTSGQQLPLSDAGAFDDAESHDDDASAAAPRGERSPQRGRRRSKRQQDAAGSGSSSPMGAEVDRTPRHHNSKHLLRRHSKQPHTPAAKSGRSPAALTRTGTGTGNRTPGAEDGGGGEQVVKAVKTPPGKARSRFSRIMSGVKPAAATSPPNSAGGTGRSAGRDGVGHRRRAGYGGEETDDETDAGTDDDDDYSLSSQQSLPTRAHSPFGDALFTEVSCCFCCYCYCCCCFCC